MQATNEVIPEGEIGSLTILIAEDEVLLRMAMSDHLRSSGFNVLECASGEETRKVMGVVGRVDVVVSDVHMQTPLEGLELAAWFGDRYPDIPVILVSGSPTIAANESWKALPNVTDFVPKPYEVERIEILARARAGARGASSK